MKRLVILSATTIVLFIATWVMLVGEKEKVAPSYDNSLILPKLGIASERVSRIIYEKKGKKRLRFYKDDKGVWRIKELYDYPAKLTKVANLIQSLADSKKIRAKTAKKELWSQLGLDDKRAKRIIILTDDEEEEPLADIYIGRFNKKELGTYVRLAGSEQTWLVSGKFEIAKKPVNWLEQDILSIDSLKIRSLKTKDLRNGQPEVILGRDSLFEKLDMINKPEDIKYINEYNMGMIVGAFSDLIFSDVMPERFLTEKHSFTAVVQTFDGIEVTMKLYGAARIKASIEAKYIPELSIFEASKYNDSKGVEDLERISEEKLIEYGILRPEIAKRQVKIINERSKGWIYSLPKYKVSMLTRSYQSITGRKTTLIEDPRKPSAKKRGEAIDLSEPEIDIDNPVFEALKKLKKNATGESSIKLDDEE